MRKRVYTVTAAKKIHSPNFVEVLTGPCEDLMYRTAESLKFKPTVWLLEFDKEFSQRYFIDDIGTKHYMKDFERIGNGDPYATVDRIIIEATAFEINKAVNSTAESQMMLGIPIEQAYEFALEFWHEIFFK